MAAGQAGCVGEWLSGGVGWICADHLPGAFGLAGMPGPETAGGLSVALKSIHGAGAVGTELLAGKLAPCMRTWTGRLGPGVKVSPAQQLSMLQTWGKAGDTSGAFFGEAGRYSQMPHLILHLLQRLWG